MYYHHANEITYQVSETENDFIESYSNLITERSIDDIGLQVRLVQLLEKLSQKSLDIHDIIETDQNSSRVCWYGAGDLFGHFEGILQLLYAVNKHHSRLGKGCLRWRQALRGNYVQFIY